MTIVSNRTEPVKKKKLHNAQMHLQQSNVFLWVKFQNIFVDGVKKFVPPLTSWPSGRPEFEFRLDSCGTLRISTINRWSRLTVL